MSRLNNYLHIYPIFPSPFILTSELQVCVVKKNGFNPPRDMLVSRQNDLFCQLVCLLICLSVLPSGPSRVAQPAGPEAQSAMLGTQPASQAGLRHDPARIMTKMSNFSSPCPLCPKTAMSKFLLELMTMSKTKMSNL